MSEDNEEYEAKNAQETNSAVRDNATAFDTGFLYATSAYLVGTTTLFFFAVKEEIAVFMTLGPYLIIGLCLALMVHFISFIVCDYLLREEYDFVFWSNTIKVILLALFFTTSAIAIHKIGYNQMSKEQQVEVKTSEGTVSDTRTRGQPKPKKIKPPRKPK